MSDSGAHLSGKNVVITGAGRGIGQAIAHVFAGAGANLVLVSRSEDQLQETQRSAAGGRSRLLTITADVSKPEDVEKIAAKARKDLGGIDILINNAGSAVLGTIAQLSVDDIQQMIATNIQAMVLCAKAFWNDLAATKGAVINISSLAGYDPFPGLGAYGATKAFVNFYTKVLADEGASQGIRVYAIAPGAVETGMLRGAFPDFPKEQTLRPDDIANLALAMISPPFRYSSGQVVQIQKRGSD